MTIKRMMMVFLAIVGAWCVQAAYTDDCITFASASSFTLYVNGHAWDGTMWTSTDKTNWTVWKGETVTAVPSGGKGPYKLYVRGDTSNTKITGIYTANWQLEGSSGIACSGNIETLRGATGNAPSTTSMADYCYHGMFRDCTLLTEMPTLPATMLSSYCYYRMFQRCISLTAVHELSATQLAKYCYYEMFKDCTALTSPPVLSTTQMAEHCCYRMFSGCTALKTAPVLPANTLAVGCYCEMFKDCTALTVPPALPETTLSAGCYQGMFAGCTSLTNAPALPAATLAGGCYYEMFRDCALLTAAPELPAMTLADNCYFGMFKSCSSLTNAPALPAATLAIECYGEMFLSCTSLEKAPDLYAGLLPYRCYARMFLHCTSLKVAPVLPATVLEQECYSEMFCNCTALKDVPELPATMLENLCYEGMFLGCTSLVVNVVSPGEEWKIPVTSTTSMNWGTDMFKGTAGTLQGQPALNTTYYIASALMPSPGSSGNPWQIGAGEGDTVDAWTNGTGKLIVEGAGKMKSFAADGSDVPWPVADIAIVEISGDVTGIGQNAWLGLGDGVTYNGLSATAAKTMSDGFGGTSEYGRMAFKGFQVEGGVVQATVALETAKSLTNEWAEVKLEAKDVSVDSNGRIIIIHDAGIQDQGFYLVQPTK